MTDTQSNIPEPSDIQLTPGTPEYDAEMIAVAEKASEKSRPQWLPEKFKTPEDLVKSYDELQKRLHQPKQPQTSSDDEGEDTQTEAAQVVESAGLDIDNLESEYLTNGDLSEASYARLEKSGITRDLVRAYIEGQEARAASVQYEVFNSVGGEQEYQNITSWAAQNLSPAEINAYNRAVDSGSIDDVKLALTGLKSRYESQYGRSPTLLGGTPGENQSVFRSLAEMTSAMKDPRYSTDRAYRDAVIAQVARSNM